MIVPMKKITFVGIESEKDRFIQALQAVGVTHLIFPAEAVEPSAIVRELQSVAEAKKFLSQKGAAGQSGGGLDYREVCARREKLGQEENGLNAEIASLRKDRSLLEPWGDFSPEDAELLRKSGTAVHFFRVPKKLFYTLPLPGLYVHISREDANDVCFAVFSDQPVDLGISEEKLPPRSISEIDREIAAKQGELLRIEKQYVDLAANLKVLEEAEARLTDLAAYRRALINAKPELEEQVFVLECWSPMPEDELVRKIGSGFTLYHFSAEPTDDDRVPVMLKNSGIFNSGEDLVKVYSFPSYKDFDPSPFVLYCFAIFFGMIVGDAGYGLVYLIITVLLHLKFGTPSPFAVRFFRLMYLLSFAVIFFGVISASYFGVSPGKEAFLHKLVLLDVSTKQGQNNVMIVSMVMGLIHLSISQAIKFYTTHDLPSLGWIIVGWSGFLLINSSMGHGKDNPVAMYCLIGGMALVVLFSSSSKNPFLRLAMGLNAALGIVQLFADVLSYLRLFALGIATVYMAQTFNMLAGNIFHGIPWVGFIFAGFVLVVGHAVNIGLGVMGGVVHGLRLNFLEWYRWSFEGDGVPYNPFRRISTDK